MFQTARTGAMGEYADIEETISPVVLSIVTEWIEARFPIPTSVNTRALRARVCQSRRTRSMRLSGTSHMMAASA